MTLEHRFAVMGTTAHVVVTGGARRQLALAESHLRACEDRWSRFRPNSELSCLNRAEGHLRIVSAATYEVVEKAVEAWWLTGGAFDPTVHDALCRLGYDRDFASIGWVEAADAAVAAPGCGEIELLASCRGVRLPVGVRLDLGGIAKGHAADQLVELLLADGAIGACVNIGGDVRVEGHGPNGGPWAIALDLGPEVADPPRVLLGAGSVCTSSRQRRVWCAGSEPVHHLIDPRNGRSVDRGLVSISVIGRYAAQAEVLTKAVFVAGPDVGTKLLEELGVAAVLVRDDGGFLEVGNVRELAG